MRIANDNEVSRRLLNTARARLLKMTHPSGPNTADVPPPPCVGTVIVDPALGIGAYR